MDYRCLRFSSKRASVIGLGCSRLGSILSRGAGRAADDLLSLALDLGITVFDTSNIYGQGDSERLVGRVVRPHRDRVIVVTKGGMRLTALARAAMLAKPLLRLAARRAEPVGRTIAHRRSAMIVEDFGPGALGRSLQGSLRRLGLDQVDMFLLHSPSAEVIADDRIFAELERLRSDGLAVATGVSCDRAAEAMAVVGRPGVGVLELPINTGTRAAMAPVLAAAQEHGIAVLAREVLSGGREAPAAGARLREAAETPGVHVALVGTSQAAHLAANLADAGYAAGSSRR
jgi:aryl-alcohol dehydrogenase-like predicted oxidoreductase